MSVTEQSIEPYKLSEIFSIIPEFEGDQIFLNTFLNACDHAQRMAVGDQKFLLNLHIKNKLRGKAAQLVNSRNTETWYEIKSLLNSHFSDPRDLTSLIQDLQRIKQIPGESAITFYSRLQTHNSKMHAAVQKSNLTAEQKAAQTSLLDTMTLNTLLTGLEPKLGQLIRASNPTNMIEASNRIKRELQLSYFENQKHENNRNTMQTTRKTSSAQPAKFCNFCKRNGHSFNECRQRLSQTRTFPNSSNNQQIQRNFTNPQNFSNSQNSYSQNSNWRNFQQQRTPQQNTQQNINQTRPSIIQPNPNFRNNQKTHHINSDFNDVTQSDYSYRDNNNYQDFQPDQYLDHPPTVQDNRSELIDLQTQMSAINLIDYDPNLNFPEQNFI